MWNIHSFIRIYLNQTLGPLYRNRIQKHRKTEGETEKKNSYTLPCLNYNICGRRYHNTKSKFEVMAHLVNPVCNKAKYLSSPVAKRSHGKFWRIMDQSTWNHAWMMCLLDPPDGICPLQQLTILSLFIVESKASKAANKGEGQASIPSKCVILKYWI